MQSVKGRNLLEPQKVHPTGEFVIGTGYVLLFLASSQVNVVRLVDK